jgi:hypothetical protein
MNINTIKSEWQSMLDRGIIPCFEYQISEDDWLLVDIKFNEEGLEFSFDSDNKRVAFDGDITVIYNNHYRVPFDLDMSLDGHLELISDNIVDGYLLVNDLYYCEED